MANHEQAPAHILLIPFPAPGNMLPLLDLAHHLSTKPNLISISMITITIVVSPNTLPLLSPLLSTSSSIHPLILPFPSTTTISEPPLSSFLSISHSLSTLLSPILQWALSSSPPLTTIISDFLLPWSHHLSQQLSIPNIVFCPFSALTVSLAHSLWRTMPERDLPDSPDSLVFLPDIPSSPSYPWYHLSSMFKPQRDGDPLHGFIKEALLKNIDSWGFIFNTFSDLEAPYLDHLRRDLRRVFAVGPIRPLEHALPADDKLIEWLNTCDDRSVVYVCLGPQTVLAPAQMEAVAAALELSEERFVWCVRGPGVEPEKEVVVPAGFEERVKGRGVVVEGMVAQTAVLEHRAVAVFVTHCGWRSVMEGMAAGVKMMTWPMGADQYVNERVVVEMGMGVRVCEGVDGVVNVEEMLKKNFTTKVHTEVGIWNSMNCSKCWCPDGSPKHQECDQQELDKI
ncbi:UDP-glycosyltransferase 89B2-like [Dioscorea cayenensis subsp. rotundata]|uniref:UDP-glycosyltransferase 89B2-like n=1 Tax=Dioscorea cayennensis subsp. rotundata TaxID=55577 RepID=A0AB40BTT3_DIOCR|nr:UDP-glycosyltransferase 89B2-like [Dioscorea cayenensis subsp. rotundata]